MRRPWGSPRPCRGWRGYAWPIYISVCRGLVRALPVEMKKAVLFEAAVSAQQKRRTAGASAAHPLSVGELWLAWEPPTTRHD